MPPLRCRAWLVLLVVSALAPAQGPAFTLSFPNGVPIEVLPDAPFSVLVRVTPHVGQVEPSSGALRISVDGAPFQVMAIPSSLSDLYVVTLPAVPCFTTLSWYVTFSPLGGGSPIVAPGTAPSTTYVTHASPGSLVTAWSDDFDTDLGWTVTNSPTLSDGAWERGIPVGGGDRGDPATAFGGSGYCYLTDNVDGNSDVDGGSTTLTSPVIDVSGLTDARISVAIWYDNVQGPSAGQDTFEIEISDDAGASWTSLESYNQSVGMWVVRSYRIASFVSLSNLLQVRFTASDLGSPSIVEAGVDAFRIEVCPPGPPFGAGAGTAGADILFVNGSAGGLRRQVQVGLDQSVTIQLDQAPWTSLPMPFALFGMVGIPGASAQTTLPYGIGDMAFAPCSIAPFNPGLFLLSGITIPGCTTVYPAATAPWTVSLPLGVPTEQQYTFQGVVAGDNALYVTNAVAVESVGTPSSVPDPGAFPAQWIHGSASCGSNQDPPIQVHQYNANTYILRQNMCANFEAPFIYLLLGQQRAILFDTGAVSNASTMPTQATVQGIVDQWTAANGISSYELVVAHLHGHGDHVAGDGQFIGQPNTTVVGTSTSSVQSFFGITNWPNQVVYYDLGERMLEIMPIPGHHSAHIAVYDHATDILLTGDSLYPGFLFISNFGQYTESINRLANFAQLRGVSHVLGTHIEMTATPGVAYPYGTTYQPNERVLELGIGHLLELQVALNAMGSNPSYLALDDFHIWP